MVCLFFKSNAINSSPHVLTKSIDTNIAAAKTNGSKRSEIWCGAGNNIKTNGITGQDI
jgi:hypothetical protein